MRLIHLTSNIEGVVMNKRVSVNIDHIITVGELEDGCEITTNDHLGGCLNVKQSYTEVVEKIRMFEQ
jgi:uncharacterized protein YlzI (FlbEa/FlbD family)